MRRAISRVRHRNVTCASWTVRVSSCRVHGQTTSLRAHSPIRPLNCHAEASIDRRAALNGDHESGRLLGLLGSHICIVQLTVLVRVDGIARDSDECRQVRRVRLRGRELRGLAPAERHLGEALHRDDQADRADHLAERRGGQVEEEQLPEGRT